MDIEELKKLVEELSSKIDRLESTLQLTSGKLDKETEIIHNHKHLGYDDTKQITSIAASVVSGGTAAGNDMEVLFNDSGSMGADSSLTYNKTSFRLDITSGADNILEVGPGYIAQVGSGYPQGPGLFLGIYGDQITMHYDSPASAASNGGSILIQGNNGGATSGNGGAVSIIAGSAVANNDNGGSLFLQAGHKNGSGLNGFVRIVDANTLYLSTLDTTSLTADRVFTFPNQAGVIFAAPDPGANKIMGWDDTDNLPTLMTLGTGLTYTHATHTLSVSATGDLPTYVATAANPGTSVSITAGAGSSGNNNGGAITLTGGSGVGNGTGGEAALVSGLSTGNASGKRVYVAASNSGAGGGSGGSVHLIVGQPGSSGDNGKIYLGIDAAPTAVGIVVPYGLAGITYSFPIFHSSSTATFTNVVDNIGSANQTADITDTNTHATASGGLFRVSYYLLCSTADVTAGAATLNLKFTDRVSAQTISSSAVLLTTAGGYTQGTVVVMLYSGNLTYGVTHTGIFGSAKYNLYLNVEALT